MANEKRLIDANALIKNGWHLVQTGKSNVFLASMSLADVPTVDAAEVVHGRWEEIEDFDGERHWKCTACGNEWYFEVGTPEENECNYCPKCGAKMDGNKDSSLLFADMEEIIDA
jgi:hypothetical protein